MRDVAVDLLLVPMQQDHVRRLGDLGQGAHPAQDLLSMIVGVAAGTDEGEDPDKGRVEELGELAACGIRSRCGSKSSSMKILPIGEPMLDTCWAARVASFSALRPTKIGSTVMRSPSGRLMPPSSRMARSERTRCWR